MAHGGGGGWEREGEAREGRKLGGGGGERMASDGSGAGLWEGEGESPEERSE